MFHFGKNIPFIFSEVHDCWKTYPLALFSDFQQSLPLCCCPSMKQYVCCAKNCNGTSVGTFSNFNLLHGRCMLLPFPSALISVCAPAYHNASVVCLKQIVCSWGHTKTQSVLLVWSARFLIVNWPITHSVYRTHQWQYHLSSHRDSVWLPRQQVCHSGRFLLCHFQSCGWESLFQESVL